MFSSGMVMSGDASTAPIRNGAQASSLPPPLGRPWRAGMLDPVSATRRTSSIEKLSLTSTRLATRVARLDEGDYALAKIR